VTKIAQAFDDVRDAEAELADELRTVGERHAADADVYHVAHLLALRCSEQLELLAPHASRYGAGVRTDLGEPRPLLERVRRAGSDLLGREEASGLLLLSDLRGLYVVAHRAELAWVVLLQVARAARDPELVEAATQGRAEAERRWKWVRTRVKEATPQALVAGAADQG
jgi:hypothetical protein